MVLGGTVYLHARRRCLTEQPTGQAVVCGGTVYTQGGTLTDAFFTKVTSFKSRGVTFAFEMGVHLVMGATFNEDRGASKENRWCISRNRRAHRIFEREGEQ